MANYIVAVSGGIDSVVLLHMMQQIPQNNLIVAHFDHGIRADSSDDARFVASLAHQYGLPFVSEGVELGEGASEDVARHARYEFLRKLAREHSARIVTAHHSDDILGSIAINLHRGTGWRGVATHDSDIARPLLHRSKSALRAYAQRHELEWHEDSTNQSEAYLRNRIRKHVANLPAAHKEKLLVLRTQQLDYKRQIDQEVARLVGPGPEYSRYFFTHIPEKAAMECLRHISQRRLTRPQMKRLLLAIKTSLPGKSYEAGSGVTVDFTSRNFALTLIK